jgi:hypothetical protein
MLADEDVGLRVVCSPEAVPPVMAFSTPATAATPLLPGWERP